MSRELGRIGQERVEAVPGLRGRGGMVREQLDVLNPNERSSGRPAHVIPDGRRADDWENGEAALHEDWVTTQLMLGGWCSLATLQERRPDHLRPQGVLEAVQRLVQAGTAVRRRSPTGMSEQFIIPRSGEGESGRVDPLTTREVEAFVIQYVRAQPGRLTQGGVVGQARTTFGDPGGGTGLRFGAAVRRLLNQGVLREDGDQQLWIAEGVQVPLPPATVPLEQALVFRQLAINLVGPIGRPKLALLDDLRRRHFPDAQDRLDTLILGGGLREWDGVIYRTDQDIVRPEWREAETALDHILADD